MNKKELTADAREFIADVSSKFLQTRIETSQDILNNDGKPNITLDDYISTIEKYKNDSNLLKSFFIVNKLANQSLKDNPDELDWIKEWLP